MAGISSKRLSTLYLRRETDADFTLFCENKAIPVHSFVLCSMSEYFEKALTNDWQEKKDKKINLKDCSVVALEVAVNFMYGIQVPEEFTELCELLNLAEMFMMENLAEVVIHRLNEEITEENYLEVCKIAEMYNKENLINKCALFVINQIGEEDAKWEVLEKLNKVLVAISKNAMKAVKHNKERKGAKRAKRVKRDNTPEFDYNAVQDVLEANFDD